MIYLIYSYVFSFKTLVSPNLNKEECSNGSKIIVFKIGMNSKNTKFKIVSN